jgi:glycosyltransferase involved in cell wall biosynthesis
MKICFITYDGVILSRGGPFVKIISLKKSLESLGCKVDLFNMWESSENLRHYDIIKIFGGNLSIYSLVRNLKYRNIDYLINPIFYSKHSASFIKIISSAGRAANVALKGFWFDYGITGDICRWAKLVMPNTRDEGEIISKGFRVAKEKIHLWHNGVSEKFLNGDPSIFSKRYGIKDFILNVGHIGPKRKNMLAFVKALKGINHPAVIIGKALNMGESEKVKKEISKNKNIILLDELGNDSEMLASAYAASDSFVLPSQFETPGRAALEAALAGAKIVITPYGGTQEYFQSWAEYVNPYSINSIKKGIETALNKPKDDKLRNFIKDNFLWSKIAEQTVGIYEKFKNTARKN